MREIDVVHTYYYTDPMCPWSWALEPALRKLAVEFGDGLSLTYVMCGMAREVGDAGPLVSDMLEASAASGMPVDVRLWLGLASHGVLEAFAADLDRCGAVSAEHNVAGTGRVKLPSLEFVAADGAVHGVYGPSDYGALRAAAVAAGAPAVFDGPRSVEDALRRFGTMATAEVASVCDLPGPRAPAELWRLATEWRVRAERVGTEYLWSLA